MPSYLSLLPDEIFHIVYRNILDECIRQTALRCRVKWLHKRTFGAAFTRAKQTNRAVVYHWLQSLEHHSLNMSTDGQRIFSYAMEIGHTTADGVKVAMDHTALGYGFVSQTTSVHTNLASQYADRVVSPVKKRFKDLTIYDSIIK